MKDYGENYSHAVICLIYGYAMFRRPLSNPEEL